ncbi:CotH kinase family protein, partial [Candidatus Saccharibacteria bacterium]|nr:CotH kinase family protein [Candidatus Saccharibacteria bacterium]
MKHIKQFFAFLYDHLEYIFVTLLFGGVFYLAVTQGSYADPSTNRETLYTQKIFDQSYVHQIEITTTGENLDDLRDNPTEKTRYLADVTIDGELFRDIAFSTRGNASLFALSGDPNSDRYSYKLNFNKFTDHGSYYGLDKLILNNSNSDASYMKDFLAFEIMRAASVATPLASYTELVINGERQGLYLAVEDLDQSFLRRNNFAKDSVLYKPEALAIDHSKLSHLRDQLPEGEDIDLIVDTGDPNFDYGGSDLVYRSNDPADYPAIFDNAISKLSQSDKDYLVTSLRSLAPAELLDPEDFWDIDAVVNYFAANNLLSNFDAYTGTTAHNYYLLASQGKNTLLPWDYNLAFAGVQLNHEIAYDKGIINWPIDSPLTTNDNESRPVWQLIIDDPENLEKYHQSIQRLLDHYLLNGECIKKITDTAEL